MPPWIAYVLVPAIQTGVRVLFERKERERVMEGKKTYIGVVVMIIPMVAKMFGYEVSSDFSLEAEIILNDIVSLVGAAYAFYGRAVSKVPGFLVKKD